MRNTTVLYSLIFALLTVSCVAPIRNKSRTEYAAPEFKAADLRAGGLAQLPVVAGLGLEGYRRPLADAIEKEMASRLDSVKVIGWRKAMERINEAELADVYESLIQGYNTTSIINRKKVRLLAKALNVRYAAFCSLNDFSERQSVNEVGMAFGHVMPEKKANVQAHMLIVDLVRGDVVQEIIGQASSSAGAYEVNHKYGKFVRVMAGGMVAELPGVPKKRPKLRYRQL